MDKKEKKKVRDKLAIFRKRMATREARGLPRKAKRPKYSEEMKETIAEYYSRGLDDRTIADFSGISKGTLYEWKNKYPELVDRIEERRSEAVKKLMKNMGEMSEGKNIQAVKYMLQRSRKDYAERQQVDVTAENHNYNYKIKGDEEEAIEGIKWDRIVPEEKGNKDEEIEH